MYAGKEGSPTAVTAVDLPADLDELIDLYARYDAGPKASANIVHRIAYAKRMRLRREYGDAWEQLAPAKLQTDILHLVDCGAVLA